MSALGGCDRVFELLDRQATIQDRDYEQSKKLTWRVELRDDRFAYPTRPELPVLNDVSLVLEPGTITASVGMSGGGKSTIAVLIGRFYDVEDD